MICDYSTSISTAKQKKTQETELRMTVSAKAREYVVELDSKGCQQQWTVTTKYRSISISHCIVK